MNDGFRDVRKCEYCGQTTPSDQFNRYGIHDFCFYDPDCTESTVSESEVYANSYID